MGLGTNEQKARMNKLRGMINRDQAALNTINQDAPTDKNLRKETELEKRIAFMKRLYGEMFMIVRDGEAKAAKAAAVPPATITKKEKKGYSGKTSWSVLETLERGKKLLEDDMGSSRSLKGFVPPEMTRELERLEAQIKRIKGETKDGLLKIDTKNFNKQFFGEASDRREMFGGALSNRASEIGKYNSIEWLQTQLAKVQSIIQNSVGLGNKIIDQGAVDLARRYTSEIQEQEKAWTKVQGPLAYVNYTLGQTEEKIANLTLENIAVPASVIESYADLLKQIEQIKRAQDDAKGEAVFENLKGDSQEGLNPLKSGLLDGNNWLKAFKKQYAEHKQEIISNTQDLVNSVTGTFADGAGAAANSMAQFIGGLIAGTSNIGDLKAVVMNAVADMLEHLANVLAASAIFMIAVSPVKAAIQFAAAVGLYGVAAMARSAATPTKRKGYEKGGLFHGPSDITVGESNKARKGGGEWVSPIDTGAQLIAEKMAALGVGSGGGGGTLTCRVSGPDLVFVLNRANQNSKAFGRGQ